MRHTRNHPLSAIATLVLMSPFLYSGTVLAQPKPWSSFAENAQHVALSGNGTQNLNQIHWQTPVDLHPQLSGDELLIHYGSPLITAANTVIVPVKTGTAGGFRVDAHSGTDGSLLWSLPTNYVLPPHDWTPVFGPVLSRKPRLYIPAAGGTVIVRETPDSATGTEILLAFYGLGNYHADPATYNANVVINTPLTSDPSGNIYFGFMVLGSTPVPLQSGIARISASGQGSWVSVAAAANDSSMTKVAHNCAPALSWDSKTLYVTVSNGSAGYLVSLDSTTLAPLAHIRLIDPKSGADAWVSDNSSASPTTGPDGDVYYGVLESPFPENHDRGWLLHYDATLTQTKTPGAFGWDDTASLVPASLVASYTGQSTYLLMTKYNNYANVGGNGDNRIAVVDPHAAEKDPITGVTTMRVVLGIEGPTPNPPLAGVKEWCINSAAVDAVTKSVLANSEDGKLYRWDLTTNTLSQAVVLSSGLGEAYTSTVIGVDGTVYAINDAILFAVGN
ncbi:MAG TPA: hypothetical protein VLX58_08405 [Bryobacteraceae bacterium]|nr:hypothetical protein [Bryobacteraceae bacterium]